MRKRCLFHVLFGIRKDWDLFFCFSYRPTFFYINGFFLGSEYTQCLEKRTERDQFVVVIVFKLKTITNWFKNMKRSCFLFLYKRNKKHKKKKEAFKTTIGVKNQEKGSFFRNLRFCEFCHKPSFWRTYDGMRIRCFSMVMLLFYCVLFLEKIWAILLFFNCNGIVFTVFVVFQLKNSKNNTIGRKKNLITTVSKVLDFWIKCVSKKTLVKSLLVTLI